MKLNEPEVPAPAFDPETGALVGTVRSGVTSLRRTNRPTGRVVRPEADGLAAVIELFPQPRGAP
jgi:hypothetical protein